MSKISYPQVVKDVANAIRTATSTTDLIPIGELADRIIAAVRSSSQVVEYKSITYNEDNTVTLVDKDDNEHTMICHYDSVNNRLMSIEFYGTVFEMTYNEGLLEAVNDTSINLENVVTQNEDYTIDFTEAYKLLSNGEPSKEVEQDMWTFAGKLLTKEGMK